MTDHELAITNEPPDPIPYICEIKQWQDNCNNAIAEYIPADRDEAPPEGFSRFRTIVGVPLTLTRPDGAELQQIKQVPMDVPGFSLEEAFANLPAVCKAATAQAVDQANRDVQNASQAQQKAQHRIITAQEARTALDQSNGSMRIDNRAARRSMGGPKRRR